MKNRAWIIIFSSVLLICTVWWLYMSFSASPSQIVGIYQNSSLVERIDLNSVTEEKEIKLSGESGTNIILVSHGHIEMKSAECPDKICVKHGELKNGSSPIVCLPNRIVIKFEDNSVCADAKTGAVR